MRAVRLQLNEPHTNSGKLKNAKVGQQNSVTVQSLLLGHHYVLLLRM